MMALVNRTIVSASKGAVSVVLRAYPRTFRHRFRAELFHSIDRDLEEGAESGIGGLFGAGVRAVADALKGVVPEHRAERIRSRRNANGLDARGVMLWNGAMDDLKYALRSLGASRTFTAVAVVVLGLAIGAATAVFSIVDAIVLRGLPFDESDRIVSVMEYVPDSGRTGSASTPQTFLDWRAHQQSFQQFAAVNRDSFRIRNERDEPTTARAMHVTKEFLPLLRVTPILGRPFTEGDEIEGAHRVAILSYGFWQRQFGGAPEAVGQTLSLNGEKWDVIAVMPADFSWPVGSQMAAEVFTPVAFRADERVRARTRNFQYSVIGRLKDGVSIAQASEEMNRLAAAVDAEHPQWNPGGRVRVVTLHEAMVAGVRSWMVMLLGAVALVLLIACANVANLMLVRSTVRGRELGIRAALGASRRRIARALVAEGLVLSLLASAVGVALAWVAVRVLTAWLPAGLPRVASISIDFRVLAAAAAAALVSGVAFGLAPAVLTSRVDLTLAFRDGRTTTSGAAGTRIRGLLVVAEVALAVVLLVGAGLFITSFAGLMRIAPGFDYHNVLSVYVNLPFERGDDFKKALARGSLYGATPRSVVAMVLGNAGVLMGTGLAIGAIGAWYLSATVEKFLFRIEPTDPRVFAVALVTLAAAGLTASALPARRAASVDPVVALRNN